MSETSDATREDEFAQNVISNIFEVFITPEIARRGGPEAVGSLRAAVVLLAPGADTEILLNEEADVIATVRATRDIQAGEEVTTSDFDLIQEVRPAQVHDDAGWIALAHAPEQGWIAAFDFRRNRGRGRRLLALADDYLATAKEAAAAERSGPCLDLAHTSAELAVTAMMYLFEDQPLGAKRGRHGRREHWLRDFARHGNVESHLHSAMATLGRLRSAARYGDPELRVTDEERATLLTAVQDLVEHARERVGEPLTPIATDGLPGFRGAASQD